MTNEQRKALYAQAFDVGVRTDAHDEYRLYIVNRRMRELLIRMRSERT